VMSLASAALAAPLSAASTASVSKAAIRTWI
jgi:hypothetical protein